MISDFLISDFDGSSYMLLISDIVLESEVVVLDLCMLLVGFFCVCYCSNFE